MSYNTWKIIEEVFNKHRKCRIENCEYRSAVYDAIYYEVSKLNLHKKHDLRKVELKIKTT